MNLVKIMRCKPIRCKRRLPVFIALLVSLCLVAASCTPKSESIFEFTEFPFADATYYAISKCHVRDEFMHIEIPATYNGLEVTYILYSAFERCKMETVALSNVKQILTNAFAYCRTLKSIDLGNVEYISDFAFGYCTSLESVEFPATLRHLGNGAFGACEKLREVYFWGNPRSLGENIFDAGVVIYGFPGGTVESYANTNGHTFVDISSIQN